MKDLRFITYKCDEHNLECEALTTRLAFQQVPFLLLPPLSAIKQLLPMDHGSVPRDKSLPTSALQLGKRDVGEGGEG